jgi:hypothetical protein
MSPNDVMIAAGEPEDISRKSNPLLLKYGCVRLSFWKAPNDRAPQLREIVVSYLPVFETAPEALAFSDWVPTEPPSEREFRLFVQNTNLLPMHSVEGPSGKQIVFPSGVTALFTDNLLHSIRLVEREYKSVAPAPFPDEREPTLDQIREMLDEAEQVNRIGANRSALLMAWAALEAALRRTASQAGVLGKIGMQPSSLLRELFAAGELTAEEHSMLEELRQIRTASAHGLAPERLDPDQISKLTGTANRLLESLTSGAPLASPQR